MKLTIYILIVALMSLGSYSASFANPERTVEIKQNTILSLMLGLRSENPGLKSSCIYMIGELNISGAVIPLMKILNEDKNEELRIAAALALYKIGTPIAIHAVKQSIRFDESERVSRLCASFYHEYLKNKLSFKLSDEVINTDVAKTAVK
jgi:hypothetical protein